MRRNIISIALGTVLAVAAISGGWFAHAATVEQHTATQTAAWSSTAETVATAAQQTADKASKATQPVVWMETVTGEFVDGHFSYDTERPFEHVAVSSAAPGVTFGAAQVGPNRVEVESPQDLVDGTQLTMTFVFSS